MGVWEMTAVIVYKSLWWILPALGTVIAIAITDKEEEKMSAFDAWELDDMIGKIEDMEQSFRDHESEYAPNDFEAFMNHLENAKRLLYEAWLLV